MAANLSVFCSRHCAGGACHLSTRQYARLVDEWGTAIGLTPEEYGTRRLASFLWPTRDERWCVARNKTTRADASMGDQERHWDAVEVFEQLAALWWPFRESQPDFPEPRRDAMLNSFAQCAPFFEHSELPPNFF